MSHHSSPADVIAWVRARLGQTERPELEQAALRVGVVGLIVAYMFVEAFRDGTLSGSEPRALFLAVLTLLFGLVLLAWIVQVGGRSVQRRVLGMLVDNAATTMCLLLMDEAGAIIIGVYLFVTFGNGFRYGRKYLHASQGLALVGFGVVIAFSEYWRTHVSLSVGVLLAVVILPFYVGVLAQRIEEARRRADEANRAKGRFLANMSHEMRTPLNGVIAMADVLRETHLSEAQREIVETMTTSAHLLLAQVEDVLDMAKIDAGRITIEKRPFEPSRLLTAIVKVILPQARYKGLAVHVDLDASVDGWFLGDSQHIRQIVLNLLANAVKFTERGEIRLVAHAKTEAEHTELRIEVRDTGIGIPFEKQQAIFEPFSQADDSTTRVYGGTGLGTTIARHLAVQMGGSIGLESQVGMGSLFWLSLPLQRTEPSKGIDLTEELTNAARTASTSYALASSRPATIYKLRRARILIAEDNPTNQRVAQLILESGGHEVTIVDNGEKALDALEKGGFDLALFDLSMPIVSGLEALKLYRFSTPTPIPVLILSANVTTEAIDECQRSGASEFIPKPLRASMLLEAIERHLAADGSRPQLRPLSRDAKPSLSVVELPVLELQVMRDLEQLSSDPTFVERLVRGFQDDTVKLAVAIRECFQTRRYERVKDHAHALKGGAASVGASQLCQLATKLERATHDSLRLNAATYILELDEIAQRTSDRLSQYVASRMNGAADDSSLPS